VPVASIRHYNALLSLPTRKALGTKEPQVNGLELMRTANGTVVFALVGAAVLLVGGCQDKEMPLGAPPTVEAATNTSRPDPPANRPVSLDVTTILAAMRQEGQSFNPEPLCTLSRTELSALLDHLLPETRADNLLSEVDVGRLIRQLGDPRWSVREHATRELIAHGRSHSARVKKATWHDDPKVRVRAKTILTAWKAEAIDTGPYRKAFQQCLKRLESPEALLDLAHRVRVALRQDGLTAAKRRLLGLCLQHLALAPSDEIIEALVPILDEAPESVGACVLRQTVACRGRRNLHLLVEAGLRSDRQSVVEFALSWSSDHRSAEVKRLVYRIFEGDNEALKFTACFPLMHDYGDPKGVQYLLTQVNSPDKARARRAISWIGDACNNGKPATPAILEKLLPFLNSQDAEARRVAADALGTYSGEKVVKALIPMLADPVDIIAAEATSNLRRQRDADMVRRLLQEAADGATNLTVRQKSRRLLSELGSR